MGGAKDSMPLAVAYLSAALIGRAWCWEGACLQDGRHKTAPGPEPYLRDCMLYEENSCCSQEHVEDILGAPTPTLSTQPWDRCGSLSSSCESFLKRVACFHRCSPEAVLWLHPHRPDSIQATPLCHSFCTDWFEACKTDITCARNWTTDFAGVNCTGPCVQFQQMFQDGRDLCDRLWGDSFLAVEDSPCCLTLSSSDKEAVAALMASESSEGDSSEVDTTKTGLPQYHAHCRLPTTPPQAWGSTSSSSSSSNSNNVAAPVRKRSVAMDDGEGSGSGFYKYV